MPRDAWRRAKNDEIAKEASSELAREGRSTFPHVGDDREDEPVVEIPRPEKKRVPVRLESRVHYRMVWCVCDSTGTVVEVFDFARKPEAERSLAAWQSKGRLGLFLQQRRVEM